MESPELQDQLSLDERRKVMEHLVEGRNTLVRCVTGLAETQWAFKPSAQRWSILEILEHLLIFETTVHGLISSMKDLHLDNSDHNPQQVEQYIVTTVPDRSKKLRTVIQGEPTGRLKSSEALGQFLLARAGTQKLLDESPYLRGRIIPNSLYTVPEWDGYLWILALALHTIRHTTQMEELKNEIAFPRADDGSAIN